MQRHRNWKLGCKTATGYLLLTFIVSILQHNGDSHQIWSRRQCKEWFRQNSVSALLEKKPNEELNYIKDIALNDIKDKAMMRDVHFINVKRPFYWKSGICYGNYQGSENKKMHYHGYPSIFLNNLEFWKHMLSSNLGKLDLSYHM